MMMTHPFLLAAAIIISLSLLVSADPFPSSSLAVGSPPPVAGNGSRPTRHTRGFSVHGSAGVRGSVGHRGSDGVQRSDGVQGSAGIQGSASVGSDSQAGSGRNAPPPPPPGRRFNQFLDAHNQVRASVGEPPLVWDRNLAKYARNWANGRVTDCKMIHSEGPYGENIFWGSKDRWTAAQVVNMWVDEVQNYDPVHNSCRDGEVCGHYTQVVWRDSTKVGCARVTCNNGGMYAICVYNPPGNYIGENPFAHNER